jgi:hypothetical protein
VTETSGSVPVVLTRPQAAALLQLCATDPARLWGTSVEQEERATYHRARYAYDTPQGSYSYWLTTHLNNEGVRYMLMADLFTPNQVLHHLVARWGGEDQLRTVRFLCNTVPDAQINGIWSEGNGLEFTIGGVGDGRALLSAALRGAYPDGFVAAASHIDDLALMHVTHLFPRPMIDLVRRTCP